jgi:hypothetical protein
MEATRKEAKMLKNAEDARQKEVSTFGEIEHLLNGPSTVQSS